MNSTSEEEIQYSDGVSLLIREAETQHGSKIFTTLIDTKEEIISRYQFRETDDGYLYENRDKKPLPPKTVIVGMEEQGYAVTNVPSFISNDTPTDRAIVLGELLQQVADVYESHVEKDLTELVMERIDTAGFTLQIVIAMAESLTESEFIQCVEHGVNEAKINSKIESVDDLYDLSVTIETLQKIVVSGKSALPVERRREMLEDVSDKLDLGEISEGSGSINWETETGATKQYQFD